jgi:hypothetical protein
MGGAQRYPSIAIDEDDGFREGLNPSYSPADFSPAGKSLLDFQNLLSSPSGKNILIFRNRKSGYKRSRPAPSEGRWPSSRTLERDAVDADAPITNGTEADGEAVWS